MNRRGFLGAILAAGFAPAAIGSGVLMPVRQRIVTPHWADGLSMWQDASLSRPVVEPIMMNGGRLWQDLERRIPVTAEGQPVAVVDRLITFNGQWLPGIQRAAACRPVLAFEDHLPVLRGDQVDDFMQVDARGIRARVSLP